MNYTPRAYIIRNLQEWIDSGALVLRSKQGTRSDVAKRVRCGELFPTSYAGVMFTSKEARDVFETYVDNNRVLDKNKVAVRKGIYTEYALNHACESGDLIKIDAFSNTLSLYVD